ncbi:dTDP-glucose 4,6-dehydratase [Prochlorococcus marinus]|uniref:dTDP-glucose 4,6-dehydratase n=1 Tax=Prochlorococcus marinus (strain MIT 9303) TaxID=59922 RepID=A2C5W3_PROM3|nr:dTDP-glucose 4,6-dehydratase [Prochlorococcus marinus]ABM76873.1 dTDP-D-glucose 4,6-dehydratase [Prochlorococcus marinus str. MIT 9303]
MSTEIPEYFSRVLVTGGAGFIGGALIKRLLKESNMIIFNLDKFSYASDHTSIYHTLDKLDKLASQRYKPLQVDLSDPLSTQAAVCEADPDLVFHLAAESHVDRSINNPRIFFESNVEGTFNLLESLRSHYAELSKERRARFRLLHISTDEVFGSLGDQGFFCETSPYQPRSPYSATKAASDHLVQAWIHTYGLPAIITNCTNNYGPYQFPEKLIPLVILKMINNEDIPIYGNGKNVRDWLFVEDHIDALLLVASNGLIGNRYCIGGTSERTNKQVVESISIIMDKLHPIGVPHIQKIKYVDDRPGHDLRYAMDINHIKTQLGWKPTFLFNVGLEITVKWYLDHLAWVKHVAKTSSYQGERLGLI